MQPIDAPSDMPHLDPMARDGSRAGTTATHSISPTDNPNERTMNRKRTEKSLSLFDGLAHPMRRRILRLMMNEKEHATATPRKLADSLDEHLSVVSYHVKTLANCMAIRLVRTAPVSGSTQHFYRLSLNVAWARTALETTND